MTRNSYTQDPSFAPLAYLDPVATDDPIEDVEALMAAILDEPYDYGEPLDLEAKEDAQ